MSRLHDFLATYALQARPCGRGFSISCPHPDHGRGRGDRNRSVTISEGEDGRILIRCHGGCRPEDVLAALGARWSDLFAEGGLDGDCRRQLRRAREPRRSLRIDLGLPRDPEIASLARAAVARASGWPLEELSRDTGPSVESYERLHVGYLVGGLAERAGLNDGSIAYSFPMRLPDGPVCGIRVRSRSGYKWAVEGSRNGLFTPDGVDLKHDRLVLCEGPTDTAALLDLGFPAIGRASAHSGIDLCTILAEMSEYGEIVVFGDNDGPGLEGAVRCREAMSKHRASVVIVAPPPDVKDLRAWLLAGAEHSDVEARIAAASSHKVHMSLGTVEAGRE